MSQDGIPLERGHTFQVNDTDFIKVTLELLSVFCRNRVDADAGYEVFLNDGKIKILHAEVHALKVDNFNVIDVKDEEWELTEGDEAFLCWSNFDDLLLWAT